MDSVEKINIKDEKLIVKLDDLDKEDDLVLLSKEIEKAKLDDTINLSKYLNEITDINNECLIK